MVREAIADIYSVQKKIRDLVHIPYPKVIDDDWMSKMMDFVNTDHVVCISSRPDSTSSY